MFASLSRFLRSLLGGRKPEPQDPYAYVGSPLRKGPRPLAGAIALAEPELPTNTRAVGR